MSTVDALKKDIEEYRNWNNKLNNQICALEQAEFELNNQICALGSENAELHRNLLELREENDSLRKGTISLWEGLAKAESAIKDLRNLFCKFMN